MRRRTRQYALVLLLLVPAMLGALVLGRLHGARARAGAILPAWMVAAVTGRRAVRAPCPACGQAYFFPSFMNFWSKRFAHCGRPKWSDSAAWGRERETAGHVR